VYIYIYIHICTYIYTYEHTYIGTYIHIYVDAYIQPDIHTYIYSIYIHTTQRITKPVVKNKNFYIVFQIKLQFSCNIHVWILYYAYGRNI